MSFVIVSYRANGEKGWWARGHYDCEDRWDSDLQVFNTKDLESAAELIAQRIAREPDAEYLNLVYDSWWDFTHQRDYNLPAPRVGADSVYFFYLYLHEPVSEAPRKEELEKELRALVEVRFGQLLEETKIQAEEDKRRLEKARAAEQLERDRKEYERLRAILENPS